MEQRHVELGFYSVTAQIKQSDLTMVTACPFAYNLD